MPRGYLKRQKDVGSKKARGGSSRSCPQRWGWWWGSKDYSDREYRHLKRAGKLWFIDELDSIEDDLLSYDEEWFDNGGVETKKNETASVQDHHHCLPARQVVLLQEEVRSNHEESSSSVSFQLLSISTAMSESVPVLNPDTPTSVSVSSWELLEDDESATTSSHTSPQGEEDSSYKMILPPVDVNGSREPLLVEKQEEDHSETDHHSETKNTEEQCCVICWQDRPLMTLMKRCDQEHDRACYDCLRRLYVTGTDLSSYPLKCFGCSRLLHDEQIKRLIHSPKEFKRHYTMRRLARVSTFQDRQDPLNKILGKEDWARCPTCRMVIVKDGGCDHMTCICGSTFDWSQTKEQRALAKRTERINELMGKL